MLSHTALYQISQKSKYTSQLKTFSYWYLYECLEKEITGHEKVVFEKNVILQTFNALQKVQ